MKYVHTNIIARDWRKLSEFYQKVFGCRPIGPKRDLSGEWIEKMTGISGVKIEGEHLLMPGSHEKTPTLEIFSYNYQGETKAEGQVNNCGFSHIAFEVEDVRKSVDTVIEAGGSLLGEIVSNEYEQLGTGTFVYVRDPEGNIIELQSWVLI